MKNKRKPSDLLLAWYDRFGRTLPWRALKGKKQDPYRVWLSEIMLQQTTVAAVGPYFLRFLERWPDLSALARAKEIDVLRLWSGLGYYRRAKNLLACAKVLMKEHNGQIPSSEESLLELPGIGPYTAAAIAAIAFDRKANVVDGNVERVMARLHALETPLPRAKKELRELAASFVPEVRTGDYAQALMDLGATVCTARMPKCALCPWNFLCLAFSEGQPGDFPKRQKTAKKPILYGTAFVLKDRQGRVFLRRRPDKGLLAGMMEVPSSAWASRKSFTFKGAPIDVDWKWVPGQISHTFTHFSLVLRLAVANLETSVKIKGRWTHPNAFEGEALPSVMRKILAHAGFERKGSRA